MSGQVHSDRLYGDCCGTRAELRWLGTRSLQLPEARCAGGLHHDIPKTEGFLAGRNAGDDGPEYPHPATPSIVNGDDWSAYILSHQRKARVHPFPYLGIPHGVAECAGVGWIHVAAGQDLADIEIEEPPIVMDQRGETPVSTEDSLVSVLPPDGLHHPQETVGTGRRVIPIRARSRPVLEQEADRLPLDTHIPDRCNLVDDPPGRHPAPRSDGVNPKRDVHNDPFLVSARA